MVDGSVDSSFCFLRKLSKGEGRLDRRVIVVYINHNLAQI